MSLNITFKENTFSVGDTVKVFQKIVEGEKSRTQIYEGMIIAINNRDEGKSFTIRKIGSQKIGIELIFQLFAPSLEKIELVKSGHEGVHHAKLYYTREKSVKEVDKIYKRINKKGSSKKVLKTKKKK